MEQPSLSDPKLAELTGILLGDGSIGRYQWEEKTQYRVKVTLSGDEERFVSYVRQTFESLFRIDPLIRDREDENVLEVQIFRRDLFEFLTENLGLNTAPKWERAIIPEIYLEEEAEIHLLRGYFDTDGSVVLANNNGILYPRLEMKICPSPMQQQFLNILDRQGFCFGAYDIGRGKIRVQMNGQEQLQRWIDEIGFNNLKHVKKAKIAGGGFEPPTSGL